MQESAVHRHDVSAATAVVSVLLTGAFVLQALGIPPLVPLVYTWLLSHHPPQYVDIALNAAGSTLVLYHIAYIILLEPAARLTGHRPAPNGARLDVHHFTRSDLLIPAVMVAVYAVLIANAGLHPSKLTLLGGLSIILASLVARIIPRIVASWLPDTPLYALEIVVIGTPLALLALLPALLVVLILPTISFGPFL